MSKFGRIFKTWVGCLGRNFTCSIVPGNHSPRLADKLSCRSARLAGAVHLHQVQNPPQGDTYLDNAILKGLSVISTRFPLALYLIFNVEDIVDFLASKVFDFSNFLHCFCLPGTSSLSLHEVRISATSSANVLSNISDTDCVSTSTSAELSIQNLNFFKLYF